MILLTLVTLKWYEKSIHRNPYMEKKHNLRINNRMTLHNKSFYVES